MKRIQVYLNMLALATVTTLVPLTMQAASSNTLRSVEIFNNGNLSTEVRFIFTHPFQVEQKVKNNDALLSIFFPSTHLGDFDKESILAQMYDSGLVQGATLDHIEEAHGGVLFHLKFIDTSVLVRLNKMKSRNILILEIYSKDILKKIHESSDGPLLLSQRDAGVKKKVRLTIA